MPKETLVSATVRELKYKDWEFHLGVDEAWLQVRFQDNGVPWGGRKWTISPHMTKGEIVQTALKAILAAEEHEAREKFTYRGRAIFGPHYDVDKLVDLIDAGAQVPRKEKA